MVLKKRSVILLSILLFSMMGLFLIPNGAAAIDNEIQIVTSTPKSSSDGWLNFTYPAGEIPDVALEFIRGAENVMINLENLLNYTEYENQTFPLYVFDYNTTAKIYGINPLYLFELLEWGDVGSVNISAFDGYGKIFNVTDFILSDGEFYKYTDASYSTMIGLAIEIDNVMHWLDDFDSEQTNEYFRIFGENLPGNMIIKNVSTVEFIDEWNVNIYVDEEFVAYYNSANLTSIANFTLYNWGYSDDGFGWPDDEGTPVTCVGYTVESLIDPYVDDNDFYEVSFIAFDGYGANKIFDQKDMELGMDDFDNEGKQPMIMENYNNSQLGFYRGPYQLIAPGASKGNYIGGIVEIRVTVDDLNWYTPELPSTAVPTAMINMTKNGINSTYSLDDILMYNTVNYHSIQISSWNISSTVEVFGFNPLHLMEVEGWGDAWTINIGATLDGYNSSFAVEELLLRDPNYYSYSDHNATIIAFMVNNSGTMEWLSEYNAANGNFRVYGDDLDGSQKIKNVDYIILEDYWRVNVTLNGTVSGSFSSQNATVSVGDYVSYDWGYSDEGYGWPDDEGNPVECSGYTMASIIDTFVNNPDQNYTVSVIALDGYGANKVFTKNQIENGFINDDIDNDGNLAILMNETEGNIIGYRKGPYQLIAPGLSKGNYIGLIVEIRITLIPSTVIPTNTTTTTSTTTPTTTTTTDTDKGGIPGFTLGFIIVASIGSIALLSIKRRK